jgi:hypothetical protein
VLKEEEGSPRWGEEREGKVPRGVTRVFINNPLLFFPRRRLRPYLFIASAVVVLSSCGCETFGKNTNMERYYYFCRKNGAENSKKETAEKQLVRKATDFQTAVNGKGIKFI